MPNADANVLYLNIVILDASQAVHDKVKKKVHSKLPPPLQRTKLADRAAKVASKHVKPSRVAAGLGKKLCSKLPRKMAEKGLTVEMDQVFIEKNYVVLQLQVQHVDAMLLEKTQREENSDLTCDDETATEKGMVGLLLEWGLYLMGDERTRQLQEVVLPEKIQLGMQDKIQEMMDQKFQQKGLEADVVINQECKQARFFYKKLRELREEQPSQSDSESLSDDSQSGFDSWGGE